MGSGAGYNSAAQAVVGGLADLMHGDEGTPPSKDPDLGMNVAFDVAASTGNIYAFIAQMLYEATKPRDKSSGQIKLDYTMPELSRILKSLPEEHRETLLTVPKITDYSTGEDFSKDIKDRLDAVSQIQNIIQRGFGGDEGFDKYGQWIPSEAIDYSKEIIDRAMAVPGMLDRLKQGTTVSMPIPGGAVDFSQPIPGPFDSAPMPISDELKSGVLSFGNFLLPPEIGTISYNENTRGWDGGDLANAFSNPRDFIGDYSYDNEEWRWGRGVPAYDTLLPPEHTGYWEKDINEFSEDDLYQELINVLNVGETKNLLANIRV